MRDEYLKRIEEEKQREEHYKKWHKRFGYLKIADIFLFALSVFSLSKNMDFMVLLLALIFVELYILLIVCHNKAVNFLAEALDMQAVFQGYIDRIDGNWQSFKDTGEDFLHLAEGHDYAWDLDILGKGSVFQYLNTAYTTRGREIFAEDLLNLSRDKEEIIRRQDAVYELSESISFPSQLQFNAKRAAKEGQGHRFMEILKDIGKIEAIDYVPLALPCISIVLLLGGLILRQERMIFTAASFIAGQALLWVYGAIKLHGFIGEISGAGCKMDHYTRLFQLMEGKTASSHLLRAIKKDFFVGEIKASGALFRLRLIIDCVNLRRNAILYFALNIFLLWDYFCALLIKMWQSKYGVFLEKWLEGAGRMESLVSFANLSFVDKNVCVPALGTKIAAKSAGHPLINADCRVDNDFVIDDDILIVSGSNMSGKTTFLRTVGVNMVLGLNGGYVCADEMEIPILGIVSSMRNIDDLHSATSTFYAELKKVRRILDLCAEEKTLFLIDEIFKGTNSVDRLKGAEAVIKSLSQREGPGLITTHDLELCNMADGKKIHNYSFCENYEGEQLVFDYKLRKGKSEAKSASYLMKMLGILPSGE